MEARAKLFGHAIHPMLIAFPVGLLVTAVVFDVVYLLTDNGQWAVVSFWMIAAGIIGGLLAAVFGFIDYLAIPEGTRARRIGRTHGIGNLVVVILFALSWWLRRAAPADGIGNLVVVILFALSWWLRRAAPAEPAMTALICSFAGVALATVTAWMGGELVERLGVGVDDGAHLDAPSSLSGKATGGPGSARR